MKKIILTIILSLCLIAPTRVYADMGAPVLQEYEAIVAKDNGAILYDYDQDKMIEVNTISKGTKVNIIYEEYRSNDWYGTAEVGDTYYYIKLNDLMLANAKFDLKNAYKLSEKQEVVVIGEGVYLYNGPSKIYAKSSKELPKNTKLTYEYTDGSEVDGNGPVWVYADYKGQKGWLFVYPIDETFYPEPCNVASVINNKIITITNITSLYSMPNETSSKIDADIPKNVELEHNLYYGLYNVNLRDSWVKITYNNKTGWIKIDEEKVIEKEKIKAMVVNPNGLKLYTEYDNLNSITNKEISPNEKIEILYMSNNWAYLNYKGNNYWANTKYSYGAWEIISNDIAVENDYYKDSLIVYPDTAVYEIPNGKKKGSIDNNKKVKATYEYRKLLNEENYDVESWLYLENENGWIKGKNLAIKSDYEYKTINKINMFSKPYVSNDYKVIEKDTQVVDVYEWSNSKTSWFYVSAGEETGWVKRDYLARKVNKTYKVITENGITIFDDYNSPNSLGKVDFNEKIKVLYSYYNGADCYYIKYKNITGWIYDYDNYIELVEDEEEKVPNNKPEEQPLPIIDKDKNNVKETKLTTKEIIIISVLVAVCLTLTSLVTIILINKKEKSSNKN